MGVQVCASVCVESRIMDKRIENANRRKTKVGYRGKGGGRVGGGSGSSRR